MKPIFEEIQPSFGNSFTIRKFTEKDCSNLPYWHFHPEYEIVFISNGKGKRQIGSHISYYEDGDLLFLGPNLPHLGLAQELLERHVEVVVQMKERFLGNDFLGLAELQEINKLFERSKSGVCFCGHTKWEVGEILQNIVSIECPTFRLIELLKALQIMAKSNECGSLNVDSLSLEVKPNEHLRMKAVYEFVEKNFQRQFLLDEIATHINMTVPAFCRFFRKLTHKTFTVFLNEFRIANACRLLSDDQSIASVSFESGFNNLSHFNKQFKLITGVNPTNYRQNLRKVVFAPLQTDTG